jgi:hypothetical protein
MEEDSLQDKKRDPTQEEDEIAGLVAGLSPPLAKEICRFIEEGRELHTERELSILNKAVTDYIARAISLSQAFEQLRSSLSKDEFKALLRAMLSNPSGSEIMSANGISLEEIKSADTMTTRRKPARSLGLDSDFVEEPPRKRKRAQKDLDEPFVQGIDSSRSRAKKISWSEEENQRLRQIVKEEGTYSWKRIASVLNTGKTASQCNQHWKRVLNPDIRKGPWEPHEEELLNEWSAKLNFSWKEIQRRIPNRTDTQCRHQYFKALECSKVPWSKDEDARLCIVVSQLGNDWVKVASDLQRRTALQCRERFFALEKHKQQQLAERQATSVAKTEHHSHKQPESAPQQQTAS